MTNIIKTISAALIALTTISGANAASIDFNELNLNLGDIQLEGSDHSCGEHSCGEHSCGEHSCGEHE